MTLDNDEIADRLPDDWGREGDEIVRTYEFDDYLTGVDFATECAEIANEEFHHPELIIGFRTVEVRLTSHEAGGITDDDIRLAKQFDDEY
ncbi:4a-hydroxytetrahydrobiopterin dehydratase [Halohasta litchfieldiae]|jgi:4a-hydroxytetrahydrobiopterin dehydratase|uniref:4a-hydroxytetrahydrobiopterin dehydratase n=1 Tax=Halohasta litchfieldiae TaxID=1073996 RepID=A0A1H6WJD1_9EURY|nr:4a-hydroxytetrahydrobiopterin dehydratase [Halohasta litchfieldiae]ATW90023.1 4a-hydroxytetrahydrobiopterin dehydratase [Halohasta litchfieldiae]SEJ14217.1 pterin-4-alpha-carbinolamine dehydratase [Halohasta litchfieldiae]